MTSPFWFSTIIIEIMVARRIYHYHDAIGENDKEGTVRRLEKQQQRFLLLLLHWSVFVVGSQLTQGWPAPKAPCECRNKMTSS